MRRRTLIGLLAAAWPLASLAQKGERMRRVGVLVPAAADDADYSTRLAAFQQVLAQAGWVVGRNLQIDTRFTAGNQEDIRRYVAEVIALAPDAILAAGSSNIGPLMQATRTVPIVFPLAADPVGAGFVDSLSRPGGNVTGFLTIEYSLSGKWLELLKQIAPATTRVAVLRDAAVAAGAGQFAVIQSSAAALRLEVSPVNLRDPAETERAMAAFARTANGGMIVTFSGPAARQRDLLVKLAAQHRLPAIYPGDQYAAAGGLISYGPDITDLFRRAAGYVDRILRGAKPADLPVQAPTKYRLVVNLKTAKALGLTAPPALLARADEVLS